MLGKVNPNAEKKVLDAIKKVAGVKSADITFGQYDLVVSIETADEVELKNLLTDEIRKISDITKTMTLIAQKI